MPYSYFKLSTQSGYGAGQPRPGLLRTAVGAHAMRAAGRFAAPLSVAWSPAIREAGTHRSTAEVIEGVRLARTLAAMHDGAGADAARSPATPRSRSSATASRSSVAEALAHVDVGTAIGELPKGVSQTSIQDDFDRLMTRLKLEKYQNDGGRGTDARSARKPPRQDGRGRVPRPHRSSFFHRLRVLGIGFAKPLASGQQSATWAERWQLQWTPESEIALVEAVLLGETVELATAYKFKQLLDACTGIDTAADVVTDACQCGLARSMDLARKRLQELAAVSSDLKAIAHAAIQLSLVVRYGDVRKFDPSPLLPLIEELFVQGALALFGAAACDNEAAQELTVAIDELNRVSLEHHERVEGDLWVRELRKLSDADDRNPLLSGYACAVLLERGLMATEDLAREVSRRLSPGIPADLGAGWFEGLSKRNRYALLARQPLWEELAGYVQSLDDEQFKRAIVFLRRAFGGFTPHQKRQICENLAEHWGVNADAAKRGAAGPAHRGRGEEARGPQRVRLRRYLIRSLRERRRERPLVERADHTGATMPTPPDPEQLRRWRLILGKDADQPLQGMGGCALGGGDAEMDEALAAIYDDVPEEDASPKQRSAGLGHRRRGWPSGSATSATTSRKTWSPSSSRTPSSGRG